MNKTPLFAFASIFLLCACGVAPTSSNDTSTSHPSSSGSKPSSSSLSQPSSKPSVSSSSKSKSSLPNIDYIKVFAEKSYSHVWAWSGNTNFFESWPGEAMASYDENWNTYDFKDKTSLSIIFSANGKDKTPDLSIPNAGYWWYYQNQWYNEDPLEKEDEPISSSSSSSDDTPVTPIDGEGRTWYQLLVYSFADSNNDGIGDFKGIVNHLDYLKNLGIGGLWLSPIHPADSYHGYDVKDYEKVNSVYEVGGVTFAKLLEECHKKDIKVIMDMVFNHTSNNHPWRSSHSDWYTGEHIFGGGMPDLNYDNSALRAEIKRISKAWLSKGVDGFRCDAAAWIYGGNNNWKIEESTFGKSRAWWKEWAAEMKKAKSDVYLIGEVYTDLEYVEQFYETKMAAFNFSARYWEKDAIQQSDAQNKWVKEVVSHQKHVRSNDSEGLEASFISNHDVGRFASNGFNVEELKFANALNVLSPGGSYLYYGDELGLTGSGGRWEDMSFRTAMPWTSGEAKSQNYMEGQSTSSNTKSGKKADEDAKDASSIYSYTAKAIRFKNANPTLYTGVCSEINTGSSSLGALKVEDEEASYVILVNASDKTLKATVEESATLACDLATKGTSSLSEGEISLPAKSIAVLKGDTTVEIQVL